MKSKTWIIAGASCIALLAAWSATEPDPRAESFAVKPEATAGARAELAEPRRRPSTDARRDRSAVTALHESEFSESVVPSIDAPCGQVTIRLRLEDDHIDDPTLQHAVRVIARRRNRREVEQLGSLRPGESLVWQAPAGIEFQLGVDPVSIPIGCAATGAVDLGGGHRDAAPLSLGARFGLVPCQLQGGETASVELWLFAPRSLEGYVADSKGELLADVTVRAQAVEPGLGRVTREATTNQAGQFKITSLFPTVYSVALVDDGPHDAVFAKEPKPMPWLHDMRLGSRNGVGLVIGGGPAQLCGRAVDESGAGVAGISVIAYYLEDGGSAAALTAPRRYTWADAAIETRTDTSGAFCIDGLERARLAVQVGAKEAANGGERRLAALPELSYVDLGAKPTNRVSLPSTQVQLLTK